MNCGCDGVPELLKGQKFFSPSKFQKIKLENLYKGKRSGVNLKICTNDNEHIFIISYKSKE